ncbi:DinB family protein [Flavobacterium silvisoli]|uniref:DinB family protein n=1 Tax=Flavobacterium silvisoli TaxID=2529433 RepID=A0A4Q9Z4G3_9FLAO|nr:DinB family protein [Flavobacterium silvisoli]TBX71162.1 DinB family protein [Flavobacterium silvisoli]
MTATFEINRSSRNMLLKFLENYSLEQLNTVPEGYSNNLIWNIAHIIVVQQMLVYKLSGLPMMVSDEMVERYKRGTKPEAQVTQEEINEIKSLLFATLEQTQKDFENGIFKNYHEFTTMTGYHLQNARNAMEFNNFHEATHLGIMMQLKKFV